LAVRINVIFRELNRPTINSTYIIQSSDFEKEKEYWGAVADDSKENGRFVSMKMIAKPMVVIL